jgi:hypothetical protein
MTAGNSLIFRRPEKLVRIFGAESLSSFAYKNYFMKQYLFFYKNEQGKRERFVPLECRTVCCLKKSGFDGLWFGVS